MSTFQLKQDTVTNLSDNLNEKQDKGNYVTTDSGQTITAHKIFELSEGIMSIQNIVDADQQKIPETRLSQQFGLFRNKTYSKGDGFSSWVQ